MSKNYILVFLAKAVREYVKEPYWGLPKDRFEQRSYQRWAVQEILSAIAEEDGLTPIEVVEKFAKKMERYSCESSNIAFSVAYDMAMLMYDILLTTKGEKRK